MDETQAKLLNELLDALLVVNARLTNRSEAIGCQVNPIPSSIAG